MTEQPIPSWVSDLLGEGATLVDVLGGGTSRTTVLLEVPPEHRRVVARHDGGAGPFSGTPLTLEREAAAVVAARRVGAPVAAVVAQAPDGLAYAVEELPGRPDTTGEAIDDYLATLGRLHAASTAEVPEGFEGFDPAGREDLAVWERIAEQRLRRPAPLLTRAFHDLRRHGAFEPVDVVLCHGDAGTGNYLHDDGRVTGLVDWEMAHTGDPHDDLASVAVRAMLTRLDLGDYRARVAAHWEPASGLRFDERRFQLGVAATLARMVVSCLVALDHTDPGTDRTVQHMGLPVMEVHLVRALAALEGIALPEPDDTDLDRAFAAEAAALIAEGLEPLDHDLPADASRRRRLRYLADQLGQALGRGSQPPPPDPTDLPALWTASLARLATLPASRRLAESPIPGATWC